MADKPKRNPGQSQPPDAADPHDTVVPKIDKTVELSSLEKDPDFDPFETDVPVPADASTAGENSPTLESTIIPEAGPNNEATVALADLERTVEHSDEELARGPAVDVNPGAKTVPVSYVDQTVELSDLQSVDVPSGLSTDATVVEEPAVKSSIRTDTRIDQTINPRELSDEDNEFWGSLSRASAAMASQLSPAINRSLSETKLHLRGQVVTTSHSALAKQSDYRLVRLLGKGGMGNVYVARQGSLDRLVALKVIRPLDEDKRQRFEQKGTLKQVEQDRRMQFLSEAVVTGDLDHPSIVPIHDIAVTGDDTLFYSMKRVSGSPWSKVIAEKSRDENLDILLRVSDAIGFAHTRGVVHRDIKPENIMLGEFGVVMVMDWGLALAKPEFEKLESIHQSHSLGGSPAYMAPEMAIGPVARIGPASDIYLLGATLFQIITGVAPHYATSVSECLKVVASNKIRDVSSDYQGELMQIALKAMATRAEDRYADVREFQSAIREYRSHSESIALATNAQSELDGAATSHEYEAYARARFGFEQSLKLWPDNSRAIAGVAATRIACAEEALLKGDFDLGLSLLDRNDASHHELIAKLDAGKEANASRKKRLDLLRKVTAALLAFIILGGGAALYAINLKRSQAEAQQIRADKNALQAQLEKQNAEGQTKIAQQERADADIAREAADASAEQARIAKVNEEEKRKEAERNLGRAVIAEADARRATDTAVKEKQIADDAREAADRLKGIAIAEGAKTKYANYVAQIGLAKARIDENEFDEARRILSALRKQGGEEGLSWEWRWLWRQTTQSVSALAVKSPAMNLAIDPATNAIAAVLDNGAITRAKYTANGKLIARDAGNADVLIGDGLASAMAYSLDGKAIYVGTQSGDIEVFDTTTSQPRDFWTGHKTTINQLAMIDNDTLVSASDDHSIRIWNVKTKKPLAACWNLGPVKKFAITRRGGGWLIVAAIAENRTGRATIWTLQPGEQEWVAKSAGEFLQHQYPVLSIALSPTGELAATGDAGGFVYLWNPSDAKPTDYGIAIENAIKNLSKPKTAGAKNTSSANAKVRFRPLVDLELASDLASSNPLDAASKQAHQDRVRVVQFSPDGRRLLSGGEDYLLRVWDIASGKRLEKLRGHGGWVLDARFIDTPSIGDQGETIVSTSADGSIRTWRPKTYVNAAVSNATADNAAQPLHDEEILSARFNPTGDYIVTASRDRTARVWKVDPATMKTQRVATLRDEDDAVSLKEGSLFIAQSLALDQTNKLLYIASADSVVRVWDLSRGTQRHQVSGTGLNTSLALSSDGRFLLTRSSSSDAKCLLWLLDPTGIKSPVLRHRLVGHAKEIAVSALAISADGSKCFTADTGGLGFVWNGRTGEPIGPPLEAFRGYRINAAEFSPDGNELLVAADDLQLTRININSRTVVARYGHPGFVTQFALAPDGKRAITLSEQTTTTKRRFDATLWNLANGTNQLLDRAATTLNIGNNSTGRPINQQSRITAVGFSTDGKTVSINKQATADDAARVSTWTLAGDGEAKLVQAFELPAQLGAPQAIVPLDESRMLTLNGDAGFLWDTSKRELALSYQANAAVHSAGFSFDSRFVITGSHSVKIWDVKTQKSVAKVEHPHDAPLTCVEFSPAEKSYQFATCANDGSVKLFAFDPSATTTKELNNWTANENNQAINRVRFSADGLMLFAVGDGGTAKLIDLNDPRSIVNYDAKGSGNLISAAFSPDGKYVLAGGDDDLARLWPVVKAGESPREPIVFQGHADQVEDINFLAPAVGPVRVLTASRDKSARVWDPRPDEGNLAREILSLRKHTQGVTAIDATADGNVVLTTGRDADLILWPATELSDLLPVK